MGIVSLICDKCSKVVDADSNSSEANDRFLCDSCNQKMNNKMNDYELVTFDLKTYGKTKKEIFEHNIYLARNKFKPNKDDTYNKTLNVFFTEESLKTLTKSPKMLINELLQDKIILKVDNANNKYQVNNKRAYCLMCEEKRAQEDLLNGHREFYGTHDESFYEYEIREHLRIHHHYDHKSVFDGSISSPITQDVINKNIVFEKPKYEFKEHKFSVMEISNERKSLTVKLKCDLCNWTQTLHNNTSFCIKVNNVLRKEITN